jgi:penicillin-insensitive murein endopeptidase
VAVALACLALAPATAAKPHDLPPKYAKSPFSLMSLSVGAPNDGYQVRSKRLRETRHIRVKRGSGVRNYGHPALVLMLRRSAKDIASAAPNSVMLVGDLSAKKGGAISGHRSHQSGRDADIGFYVRNEAGKQVLLDRFVKIDSQGRVIGHRGLFFDDWRNWLLVRSWLRDRRAGITHVFVASPIRNRLLAYARKNKAERKYVDAATKLLKQPSNSARHDDHFHLRIACPKRQDDICVKEAVSD